MSTIAPRHAVAALTCAVAVVLLLVGAARPAAAHAALIETTPFDGQQVEQAPGEVTWVFNEPVSAATGGLRVFDAAGERVDTGEQGQPDASTVTLDLPETVPSGSYIATYRVTSADGHVIRGAFVFSVGDAADVDDDTLAAIFAGGGDTVLAVAAGAARAAGYVGALLLGGALLWAVAVGRSDDERTRARTWSRRGALLAGGATVVGLPAQSMLTSGLGFGALANPQVLGETLTSSTGIAAVVRLLALGVVLVLLRRGDRTRVPALVAGLVVLGSFLLDGHTRTVDPAWLMWAGDAAHLLAGATWFGGLVLLAEFVRARRLEDDAVGAADVVARFSRLATWSIVVVVVAGSAMSWALVRQPRALTSTDYGWTLVAKVLLVGVVVLVGAYNNRRLVPAITRAAAPAGGAVDQASGPAPAEDVERRRRIAGVAWGQLRRTVRFEAGVLVAVLAVTAFLVNLRPAAEEAGITGAFDTVAAIQETDLQLNLVVDPNRVGHNEIHFYVLDETGRPYGDLDDVTVELTQPERDIGPIVREPFVAGPGHWQLDGNDLGVPGEWIIELVVGVDRFTEARVEVPVVVNP